MSTEAASGFVHDRTHIDWLTATHDKLEPLQEFLSRDVEPLPRGMSVYPRGWRDGFGTVVATGGPQPRPHILVMSGKAMTAWRADYEDQDLIFRLAFDGVHCTRLDLARDTAGPWTPYRLRELIETDRYASSWRGFSYHCGQRGDALTVNCGSRSSEMFMRVYDKRAEMESRGEACPVPRLSRWEFELKGDRAASAFAQLAALWGRDNATTGEHEWPTWELHAAWLRSQLTLTTEPVDRENKNQRRAVVLPAWAEFLASARDSVLAPEIDERSPADQAAELARWAARSFSSTLYTLYKLGGAKALMKLIAAGRTRTSAKHRMLVANRAETRVAVRAVMRTVGN